MKLMKRLSNRVFSTWGSYGVSLLLLLPITDANAEIEDYATLDGPIPGMVFVRIPSGSFLMGSPESESGRMPCEGPVHEVAIAEFELLSTEVTQQIWEQVMDGNPSYFIGSDLPVECVSWNDCLEFISRMNEMDSTYVYRLPSEAEWEYACRAGSTTAYFWGNTASLASDYCWYDYDASSDQTTHDVGLLLPNAWELFDIQGNVSEWCQDAMRSDYQWTPTDGSAAITASTTCRVVRGGSWNSWTSTSFRSAQRVFVERSRTSRAIGFRIARTIAL